MSPRERYTGPLPTIGHDRAHGVAAMRVYCGTLYCGPSKKGGCFSMKETDADREFERMADFRRRYGIDEPPPDTPRGDQSRIATRYKNRLVEIVLEGALIGGIALYADLKYVIAAGFLLVIWSIGGVHAQLYEITIRLRRLTVIVLESRDQESSN